MSFLLAENFSSLGTVSRDTKHAQDIMDNIKKIERQSIDDFVFLIFIDVSLSTKQKRLLRIYNNLFRNNFRENVPVLFLMAALLYESVQIESY